MNDLFRINDRVIAITGGCGVLGSAIGLALAQQGASVVLLDLKTELSKEMQLAFEQAKGTYTIFQSNVLQRSSLIEAREHILSRFGRIDGLINGAGGNHPDATTGPSQPFFHLPTEAIRQVTDLNLLGTILPSQVFAEIFARQKQGVILNISSMNAFRPLTRIPAYSAAKAAVSNFTQWLAVHLAQEYSPNIRVNAIAPGFFLTEQNRFLLLDENDQLTERGQTIIDHTPMKRFGQPQDLIGAVIWLLSPASAFVTGTVIPIDGGFSAFSGV